MELKHYLADITDKYKVDIKFNYDDNISPNEFKLEKIGKKSYFQ